MSRYIFLDRDGTIIKDKFHMYKPQDIEFLPGAIEGLRNLQRLGFEFIIITNQAGVAKGYFPKQDAHRFHQELLKILKKRDIIIKKSYFCFHKEDDNCTCRKPKPELALKAAKTFAINLSQSYFVGDKDSDLEFGKNCKGKSILIKNKQYQHTVIPDFVAENLEAVFSILKVRYRTHI